MDIEKDIIQDQKETIHRLQEECKEKTDIIMALGQENAELKEELAILQKENEDIAEARIEICNQCGNRDDYNIPCKMIRDLDYGLTVTIEERDNYEQALEEIRDIASETGCLKFVEIVNEVLGNENNSK